MAKSEASVYITYNQKQSNLNSSSKPNPYLTSSTQEAFGFFFRDGLND